MSNLERPLSKAPRIRLHLNVHEPIELVELTLAFQGLGFEYQSHVREQPLPNGSKSKSTDVKLYITHIESNCILAELAPAAAMLGAIAPAFADVNSLVEFIRNTSSTIRWLRSVAQVRDLDADDIPYKKRKIDNIRSIVNMIGRSDQAKLGLSAVRYEESSGSDKTVLEMNFSSAECKEAAAGAANAIAALESREAADREKVLMYFYQTNIDDPKTSGRTGDKAVISSISPKPLSVYVIPETDQQRIRYVLDDKEHNPLHTGFVVDVNIENDRNGKPRLYRVLRVHDVIYDDDAEA